MHVSKTPGSGGTIQRERRFLQLSALLPGELTKAHFPPSRREMPFTPSGASRVHRLAEEASAEVVASAMARVECYAASSLAAPLHQNYRRAAEEK